MQTKKPQSPAMDFLVDSLKKNRKASYADRKAKADEKKLKLYPIMFGRAQALLGIVKSAKRGTGKFARANAAKASATPGPRGRRVDPSSKSGRIRALLGSGMSASQIAKKVGATPALVYNVKAAMGKAGGAPKRGPGRPRRVAATSGLDNIAGILDAVKNSERERTHM